MVFYLDTMLSWTSYNFILLCVMAASVAVGYILFGRTASTNHLNTSKQTYKTEDLTARVAHLKNVKNQLERDIRQLREEYAELRDWIQAGKVAPKNSADGLVKPLIESMLKLEISKCSGLEFRECSIDEQIPTFSSVSLEHSVRKQCDEADEIKFHRSSIPTKLVASETNQIISKVINWDVQQNISNNLVIAKNVIFDSSVGICDGRDYKQQVIAETAKLNAQLKVNYLCQRRLIQDNEQLEIRKESLFEVVRKLEVKKKKLENHQHKIEDHLKHLKEKRKEFLKNARRESFSFAFSPQRSRSKTFSQDRPQRQLSDQTLNPRRLSFSARVKHIRQSTMSSIMGKMEPNLLVNAPTLPIRSEIKVDLPGEDSGTEEPNSLFLFRRDLSTTGRSSGNIPASLSLEKSGEEISEDCLIAAPDESTITWSAPQLPRDSSDWDLSQTFLL